MQRHLHEARAADGMLQLSQVARWRECISQYSRITSRIGLRGITEPRIERNIVAGNIEAGMIENIERLQVILQLEPLVELEVFEQSEIPAVLERAAENIAAAARITVFEVVADRRAGAVVAKRHSVGARGIGCRNTECRRIQHRFLRVDSGCPLQDRIACRGSETAHRNNWIRDEILSIAPIDAGRSSAEIYNAIGLSAL